MGFTGNEGDAGSNSSPYLFIDLTNKERGSARFPNNEGNDMSEDKGDLWRIPISDFGFSKQCVLLEDFDMILVQEGGNDGWYISSIFTVAAAGGGYTLLTADVDVNKWIDGNGSDSERQLILTKQT